MVAKTNRTIMLALAGLFVACGDTASIPNEVMTKTAVEQELAKQFSDINIEINSFTRTNGIPEGDNAYYVEYSMQVVYPEGANTHCLGDGGGMSCFNLRVNGKPVIPVGHEAELSGHVLFLKTENGWQPNNVHW